MFGACHRVKIVLAISAFVQLCLVGAAPAYEPADVPKAGVLTGEIKFSGSRPKLVPIPVKKDREVCGNEKPPEALIVSPGGGVKNAVILIEGITRGKSPKGEIVLNNSDCLFVPHVSAIMAGTKAKVQNSDPVLHNTHGYLSNVTVFNLALPLQGQVIDITRRLKKPGAVKVLCDAHAHMFAWIVVHDSPYYAVTDGGGRFKIDRVPPGTYRVTMWHQGFVQRGFDQSGRPIYDEPRTQTRSVAIPPSGSASVEFVLK